MIPTSHWEVHTDERHSKQVGSGAAGSGAAGSGATCSSATGSSDGTTHPPIFPYPGGQPATPYQQVVQLLSKSTGLGVTFNSSTIKPAPTGSQEANDIGRQSTQGSGDSSRPASCPRGVWERSSIRTTSKQMPRQVGGHPSGAPRNIPPASTPGSIPSQQGGGTRASPKDPLKNVTKYRSARWKKDLTHILKAYYKHNHTSFKEVEWIALKEKFFDYLAQHQEEWRDIKENHPLQFMPYIEKHFNAATGIKLNGLSDFTEWIKKGSYYHGMVARQSQLHLCPHLVGVELPRWHKLPLVSLARSPRKRWRPRNQPPGTAPRG